MSTLATTPQTLTTIRRPAGRRFFATFTARSRLYLGLLLLMFPTLGGMLLFTYWPQISALKYAFYNWDGQQIEEFRGWSNFVEAFWRDPLFWQSFQLVLILLVANAVKMWPSIFTAIALHRLRSPRWQYVYRVLFVIPMIIPGLVMVLIWKSFFDPTQGILNQFLNTTGLMPALNWFDMHLPAAAQTHQFATGAPAWLGNSRLIIPTIVFWGFPWVGTIGVLIYLAGLQSISQDVYEAAEIDGVGSWRKLFAIELPLIMTQVRINLIFMTIGTLTDYGLLLLLLGPEGGPGNMGMVPGLYMYKTAFIDGRFGYACALGIILFVIVLFITVLYERYVRVDR